MNTSQGALYFGAGIDLNQWRRDVDSMRRDIVGLTRNVESETRNIDSAFKNLSIGIAGYFSVSALKGFAMELINVRGEFQKTEIAFSTMLGSADKARVLMGQMVDLAAKTPFGLQEVSAGAKQLLAFQVPANQVVDVLTRMGNIAAGLGVPLSRINLVYGQVRAKGRLMGDDLRQFTEAGIPMVAELAKKFNKTTAEITDMVSAGKIGFKDVQDVLFAMTNEGGMFFNLMEKQSASLSGKVANLGDAWDTMLNKIGQSSEGILYGAIESATYLVENYKEVAEILLELIAAYGIYKAAVIATSVISTNYNKTIASEIALLSISEKMKLGRAMVTQRQAEATARDTVSELANTRAKYSALQAEVSSLAIKKQQAIQSGITASAKAQEARVQLASARMELTSIQATGTAREIEIVQKRVATAQNTVIATQESASIARKRALAASTEFNTAKQQLENTAQAVGVATKNAATAAEAAQVAAKNANSIATTRLTILQNLQTIATQAGARAQAFLNATILANPYALAAVLLAAMTYAIYKQATALTALQEIQQKFKEELAQTNIGVNEQTAKLNSLITVIKKQTTSYDEAKKILAQVNTLTNNRIEGLTVEAIKTGQADAAIKAYTKSLYRQAEVMLKVQEIAKLEEERKKLNEDISNVTLGEKFNATFNPFNDNYYREGWQGAKEEQLKAIDKTLKDYKTDVEKAIKDGIDLSGSTVEVEPPKVKLGILEGLNEELKAANEAIQKAGTSAEIKKWISIRDKIQAKIDSYGAKKKKNKEERQLAEIFPFGSPKQIQQQMQLLEQSMSLVENGMVRLRKLDKFGNDKDKKGNPYFTGEIISLEEAGKRYEKLDADLRAKQFKNFQERIDEAERQWNNYYRMAEFYSKESADAQYKDLFQDSQSYLAYLEKQEQALKDLADQGILSDKQKQDLVFLQGKIRELDGTETPLENFKRGIDDALKSMPSLVDQLEYLNAAELSASKKAGSNTPLFLDSKKYIKEQAKNILQQQKDTYQEFLNEQMTFEQKKLEIEQKYNDIRKRIGENQIISEQERIRQLNAVTKKEGEEITAVNIEGLKKTDLWIRAFGDLQVQGLKTLKNLKKSLQDLVTSGKIKDVTEIKAIQDQILKIDETIGSRNPFEAIGIAVDKYKKKRQELNEVEKKSGKNSDQYKAKLEDTQQAFVGIVDTAGAAAKATIETVGKISESFGGLSEDLKQGLAEVQQLFEGIVNTVAGYYSGNYGQMISGIVQMIGAMVKLLNGEVDRDNQIKAWQRSVDELKYSYQELGKVIERTAGEQALSKQKELISNLQKQQDILIKMKNMESEKKNVDYDKVASFEQQIKEIDSQIDEIVEKFKESITSVTFKDLAKNIADALVAAFSQGEDAAKAFDKVVNDVMRNAVANALKIKILEPAVEQMVDSLYSSMGFGNNDTSNNLAEIKKLEAMLPDLDKEISTANVFDKARLEERKKYILKIINRLKQQVGESNITGSFDGLSEAEREAIKAMGENAMKDYMAALEQYKELFGESAENAQGLKGDIKGITEKTAGALEGQFNAVRINIVAVLKLMQGNVIVQNAQTALLSQIEINTRNLHQMRKDLQELNAKTKNQLAGIP